MNNEPPNQKKVLTPDRWSFDDQGVELSSRTGLDRCFFEVSSIPRRSYKECCLHDQADQCSRSRMGESSSVSTEVLERLLQSCELRTQDLESTRSRVTQKRTEEDTI